MVESAGAEAAVGATSPPPPLRKSHLGGAKEWGSPTLLPQAPERRAGGRAGQARGCGHQVRGDLASGPGAPRAEMGLSTFGPLGRSFWLFQPLWWMQEGEALSSFAPRQSGMEDHLREGT